ncbi:MAG: NUDIX domain-containing protein, partial [Nitrospinales bacterium]
VHAQRLLHRSVHIMVFNTKRELFLQKRVLTKDENPGLWDTSSAGHVNAGEDYVSSAQRELKEELGITANLRFLCKFQACSETCWEHVAVFTCVSDDSIVIDPGEISEGRFYSLDEIKNDLQDDAGRFTSTFLKLFEHYRELNEKS